MPENLAYVDFLRTPNIVGALMPFTPRAIEIAYVSEPSAPIVYLPSSSGSGLYNCESNYPFDPRNLSLYD